MNWMLRRRADLPVTNRAIAPRPAAQLICLGISIAGATDEDSIAAGRPEGATEDAVVERRLPTIDFQVVLLRTPIDVKLHIALGHCATKLLGTPGATTEKQPRRDQGQPTGLVRSPWCSLYSILELIPNGPAQFVQRRSRVLSGDSPSLIHRPSLDPATALPRHSRTQAVRTLETDD